MTRKQETHGASRSPCEEGSCKSGSSIWETMSSVSHFPLDLGDMGLLAWLIGALPHCAVLNGVLGLLTAQGLKAILVLLSSRKANLFNAFVSENSFDECLLSLVFRNL